MMRKGVSPIVASVLLIALTMAIAGILATFATGISTDKLREANQCSPTLSLLDLSFSSGNVTARIVNGNSKVTMENIKMSIIYSDPSKNKENLDLSTYTGKNSLGPQDRLTVIVPTNDTTVPRKLEITSKTCAQIPISGDF